MKQLIRRLASAILILAGLYLIPVNLVLNLPVTREYLNALQPDRFAVGWERAWSWYPLRVTLQDLAADGQTPTKQWQLDATAAGASISLLPLLAGEVRVHDLDLQDIALRLRPRPTPEKDYAELAEYFPTIRNRDPEAPSESLPEETGGSLRLRIDDIHVAGEHAFWVHQVRGRVPGELRGSFSLDARTGQIGLSGGKLDLALAELDIGSDRDVTADAWIRGRIDVPPTNFAELPAADTIKLPKIDAELDVPLPDLHFLNLLFGTAGVMDISGKGRLRGRLVMSGGEQRIGTDLIVEAPQLRLSLARFDFGGDGVVEMKNHESDENQGDLSVRFGAVDAYLKSGTGGDTPRMFEGRDLDVTLHVDSSDSAKNRKADVQLTLSVPSMHVQDLALYNALIPEKWGARLLGGAGEVSGRILLGREDMDIELDLSSEEADVRFKDRRLTTDLSLVLRAKAQANTGANLDLAGTQLSLGDVRLVDAGGKKTTPWNGEIKIDRGRVTVPIPAERTGVAPLTYLTETLEEEGFGKLLENADGNLAATLTVSRLDWIANLLSRPLSLTLVGTGQIDADLVLEDGRLTQGTKLRIPPRRLQLGMLEHRVAGQGHAVLSVVKSGGEPALRLNVEFADAWLKRGNEERPKADKMRLKAEILVPKSASKKSSGLVFRMEIPSARIPDFSFLNAYLPPGTPVKFLSGVANLMGDLKLGTQSAKGELLVKAEDVRVGWDKLELIGDLRIDLLIKDGTPKDMRFDVGGSSLRLDDFRVVGETASHRQPDWHARLQIQEAELLWQKPLHLGMKAGVTVKDSRPLIAIFDDVRGEHDWLAELATVDDMAGHLELTLDGKRAVLRDAMLGSDKINVGVKGLADAAGREAMVYARYANLTGVLEVQGDKRHFDLSDARPRFDAYVPGKTALQLPDSTKGRAKASKPAEPLQPKGTTRQGFPPSKTTTDPGKSENLFLNDDL